MLAIETDACVTHYYFGGGSHGDAEGLNVVDQQLIHGRILPLLKGQDPFDREMVWTWLRVASIPENVASLIDNAFWDLAGRAFDPPVYTLMGGAGRDRIKANASTYPNIGVPRVYADHALACKAEGHQAYKIHPRYFWNPATGKPTPGRPSNIKADIETCHLMREAVGPDYVPRFDP